MVVSLLKDHLQQIQKECRLEKKGWQVYAKAHILLLLAEIVRYCEENKEIGGDIKNMYKLYKKVRPVLDYLHAHYTEANTLEELAKIARNNFV